MKLLRIYLSVLAAIVAGALGLFVWKVAHLRFYFSGLNQPTAVVPVEGIDAGQAVPPDWQRIEFAGQRLCLPRSLGLASAPGPEERWASFGSSTGDSLMIGATNYAVEIIRARRAELDLAPPLVPRSMTLEEALCYSSTAAEFDWRMTRAELDRLAWLLARKGASSEVEQVFLRREDAWEGILFVFPGRASFQWHYKDLSRTGGWSFRSGNNPIETELIVDICRSFDPTKTGVQGKEPVLLIDGTPVESVSN